MSEWISAEQLSALVGAIYDSAIDPDHWPSAMEAMRLALDCEISTLNLQLLPSFELALNVHVNIPPRYVGLIDSAGQDVVEIWGGPEVIMGFPADQPAILSRVVPDFSPERASTRYFNEFARPQGIIDSLAVVLARDAQAFGSISWGRHEHFGPLSDREAGIASLLIPHLQRAATITRLLDLSALRQASFEAVIDRLGVPVLLVGRQMRMIHANPAAQRLLQDGELLHTFRGKLESVSPGIARALEAAIAVSGSDEAAIGRKGLAIPARDTLGRASVLHVLPLGSGRTPNLAPAQAAIFIGQEGTEFVPQTGMFEALFDLTAAEARVFAQVVHGGSLSQTAARLGISSETAKTHLKRLYAKMGVTRRDELIIVAKSLALPVEC